MQQALYIFAQYDWKHALDIGAGIGQHANILRSLGRKVTTVDIGHPADYEMDYMEVELPEQVDAVWCSHTLEHQENPGMFLKKINGDLEDGGVLAVTVPPLKHEIVGGHVTLWNAGLLLYNLILAGFDCRNARVGTYGYNVSVVVRKREVELPDLVHDCGDIERLAHLFPFDAVHGFDGRLGNINWMNFREVG